MRQRAPHIMKEWLLLLGLTSLLRRYSQSQVGAWLWSGALVGLLGFGLSSWFNR